MEKQVTFCPPILVVLTIAAFSLAGNGQQNYAQEVKRDLQSANQRLQAQREALSSEQMALSEQLTALQNELLIKRRRADLARRSTADQKAYREVLRAQQYAAGQAAQSLRDALRSYATKRSTKLLPGQSLPPSLQSALAAGQEPTREEMAAALPCLEEGLSHLQSALGGSLSPGSAAHPSGSLLTGQVVSFGPARWFVSEDGETAGRYHLSATWEVATLHLQEEKEATQLAAGEEALVSLDITGGKARALAQIRSSPLDLIQKGGVWVYPLLIIGLASLVCAILKILQLRQIHEPQERWLEEVITTYHAGQIEEATTLARQPTHPIARVLPDCIAAARHGLEIVEEVLFEHMITVKEEQRRWLPFMATAAAVAPLLGLLGTVSGLIRTFSVIAVEGTGEAQSISGGISEALITTLFGLSIAIPAFMAHALLSRRAKGIEQNTERFALKFINALRQTAPAP